MEQNEIISACCLLLTIAKADEILEDEEIQTIGEILQDFFAIDKKTAKALIDQAQDKWNTSTGLFQFGNQLNEKFSHNDKLDFISCVFEVAYADGKLHYLEHHAVKKIANILHLEKNELISAKAEIESYLD